MTHSRYFNYMTERLMDPTATPETDRRLLHIAEATSKRAGTGHFDCVVAGCGLVTSGGKRYCKDHLDLIPYVASLKQDLLDTEKEIKAVVKGGARGADKTIKEDSHVIHDILTFLTLRGPTSVEWLASLCMISKRAASIYVRHLKKQGRVASRRRLVCLVTSK